jgi:hypothetical protein
LEEEKEKEKEEEKKKNLFREFMIKDLRFVIYFSII